MADGETNWKIYNKGGKYEYFDEEKEKEWKDSFYFIQGADIQFGFIARELEKKKDITWEKENDLAQDLVNQINNMKPKPKFFVMCGDFCDAWPATEYELRVKQENDFKRIFGKLDKDIPLVCVCGNHDVGNTPTQETVKLYRSSYGDDFFSFWCGGILFLVINSQYFHDSSEVPEIAEEHNKWIEEKLEEAQKQKKAKASDETVKELESLKSVFREANRNNDENVSISKSQTSVFSDVNGHKSAHKETENKVDKNGKLFAKVVEKFDLIKDKEGQPKSVSETEVEIPSKGIHKIILKDDENMEMRPISTKKQELDSNLGSRKIENEVNKMSSFPGIEYSPSDMAEYIFWTGDEKGVALTIEEFLGEGLISRQEAINFLQSIKSNLDFMQTHYQSLLKMNDKISSKGASLKQKLLNQDSGKSAGYRSDEPLEKWKTNLFDEKQDKVKLMSYGFSSLPESQVSDDKNDQKYLEKRNKAKADVKVFKKLFDGMSNNEDYDEVLERLRVVDFLYKEYSLEEIIYQLAKVMFYESLIKNNKESQKALQRFTTFLQKEVEDGQISRRLERKILDVLLNALMDTLSQHPELLSAAKKALQNLMDVNSRASGILSQLLMVGVENGSPGVSEELPEKTKLSGEEKSTAVSAKRID